MITFIKGKKYKSVVSVYTYYKPSVIAHNEACRVPP